MFSDKNLTQGKMLGDVWKLAHNIQIENVEKTNLPNICKQLDELVTSQSVTRRLSLRASSNLIGGTAKLYKQSLDKLYRDVIKLNEYFIHRRRRYREGLDSSSSERGDSMAESTYEVPEEMRRTATEGFQNSSFSPKRGRMTEYPIVNKAPRITMSRSPSENLLGNDKNSDEEDITSDHNANDDNLDSEDKETDSKGNVESRELDIEEPFSEEENPESQFKDQDVQTSPILTRSNKTRGTTNSAGDHGFDRNLPFGYILIHDNYYSRIPRRIIFTSINSDVNNLV